ncbi:Protein of unknown function [Geosporobacter subterraneus DSM 17957]|uniref:DUF3006 domain-containing protein n=1 Tax=Geosporobacter subterraneus DSM 17957 TaxID=1121919 RepID=A0A1M6CK85_9FIRM|nr:DUF3006 domain-containing protein [Geosporobacter subterraneus]SHI61432.1 Protein of unknown function [Geosporobacter subterraneus DSM 17957]
MFVLDRIEEETAVIEWQGQMIMLPAALLPEDAKEGDLLEISIKIDHEGTKGREERIAEKARRLWE